MAAPSLPQGPETKIARAFLATLKGDELFARSWTPIVLVESPSIEALNSFAAGSCSVAIAGVKPSDHPSKRQTSLLQLLVSFYLPRENTSVDSACPGLDWMNYLRKLAWGLVEANPSVGGAAMNFATTTVVPLTPLVSTEGVMIHSNRVTFETDVDPTQGDFV